MRLFSGVDSELVCMHTDNGDFSTKQPLVYSCAGGENCLGGKLPNTDLIVCEKKDGGRFVRIKTNIPDTVVIVLFNSTTQLHGVIKGGKRGSGPQAYSIRLIPYFTKKSHGLDEQASRQRALGCSSV